MDKNKDIIQYIKTVEFPHKKVELLYRIHLGFDTIKDLKNYIASKNIDYNNIAVIKFLDMYYIVAFEDYNREFMIGKNNYFYTNDRYMMVQGKAPNFKPKFYPSFLKEQEYRHLQLYYDLEAIDKNIDIFHNDESIKKYSYSKAYVIILGLTFFSSYIQYDELDILRYYFSDDYSYIFRENPNVYGINPFKGKIMYRDGKKVNYQFFNREDRQPFWAYRYY